MNLWNLLRYISMKHLRLQKAQIFMAVAGICLGVTAIVSIGVVNRSVIFSFQDSFNRMIGNAALQITGAQSGFPESIIEKVQDVRGVQYAVPVIETDGMLVDGKERSMLILGVDVLVDTQVRDYSLTGESADVPDPILFLAKPDSILITKAMADREGFAIDQKIQVQTVEGIRTFRIRGLLNPEGPAKAMGGNVAVMDIYAAQMAFGKTGRIDRIDVSLRKGENLETVRQAIMDALPKGYMVDTPAGRTRQVENMIAKFQNGFDFISYLAILVGMYLIYNAVSISVVHRRKEIGILRAIGCRRKEIMLLFMGETLMISVIASSLGVALGLLLANSLVGAFGKVISETFVRTSVTGIHVTWLYPAIGLLCGMITSLIAALFPAMSSSRISPASAIRSVPYTEDKIFTTLRLNLGGVFFIALSFLLFHIYGFSGPYLLAAQIMLAVGISFFTPAFLNGFVTLFNRVFASRLGSAGRLAGLNLRKNLTRNAVAVAAVFFGISVFVASSGYVHSVKGTTLNWLDSIIKSEIILSSGHPGSSTNAQIIPLPANMSRELEKVPGVLAAAPWRRAFTDYQGSKVLLSASDYTQYPKRSHDGAGPGFMKNQTHFIPDGNRVEISEAFAAIFSVKKGDEISLPTPAGPVVFKVAGIVVDYSYDSGVINMDIKTYQRYWGDMLCNSFLVHVEAGAKVGDVRDEIQRRFGVDRKLYVLSALEFKNEIRKMLDDMFIFNYALNVITLTIACLGIIVALFASVLERTREIGTLRAIGMLRRQIYGVVVLESVLMGLAGGSLGSVAGIISGWLNLEGFFVASLGSAKYYLPFGAILWALLLSAGLSALAGMIPARRAAKTNIVEALAYD
ncbi:MAG: FtsX-like permease family protein [Deltaproteobacteria bacterium]|nr:FtsX-like permease family protein [Deltaproteobacteria bacterium]